MCAYIATEGNRINSREEAGRDLTYDWLRLIATIFVVIGHSAYLNIQTTYGGIDYQLSASTNAIYYSRILTFCRWIPGWVYGFHMPLFFMLSGAVMALKPIDTFESIVKSKVKRLLFPYYVYGWLFMLPAKWLGNFYDKSSFLQAMQSFPAGGDSGHLWFLIALFWTIIAFTIIEKLGERLNVTSPYALLMISGAVQLLYRYLPVDILGMKTGLSYIFWFALGYCFEYERKKNVPWNWKKTSIAFGVLLIIELLNIKYNLLIPFFLIICGSFMTYLFADICSRLFKNLTQTGIWKILIRNLFYVYLLHDPLEYIVLRVFMSHNYMQSAFGCILYTVLRTLGVFVITVILGELIRVIKNVMRYDYGI